MNLHSRVALSCFLFLLYAAGTSSGGEVSGKIVKLLGDPRKGVEITYEIFGRNPNTNVPYSIKSPAKFKTNDGVADATKAGDFKIVIDATKLRKDSHEAFIRLSNPDLETVQIPYILGTEVHNVDIVMKQAGYKAREALPRLVYRRGNESFHLVGEVGTGVYWLDCELLLTELRYFGNDDNYLYYRDLEDPTRRWAFAKNNICICVKRGLFRKAYVPKYLVWVYRDDGKHLSWKRFGYFDRIVPENSDIEPSEMAESL
jgi:hypothetical protein